MNKLFVDKKIDINASAEKVWDVITLPKFTNEWTGEFSEGMILQSDWKFGSAAVWKDSSGKIVVEGNVTKVEPGKILRYTVFDVEEEKYAVGDEDGITLELAAKNAATELHILHGDFALMKEGKKYYDMTLEAWNKILPIIKKLAEK